MKKTQKKRIKTEKEFDKAHEKLIDEQEKTIRKLIDIQFEMDELFIKNYDRVFKRKK